MRLIALLMLCGCAPGLQSDGPPPSNWPTERPEPIARAPLDTITPYPMPSYVQIVSATLAEPHFAPPWFGPADWPAWLAEGERWLTPDGEITHWAAVLDSSGMLMWGVVLMNGGDQWRVVEGRPWTPSPLNRVYDPCNYQDEINQGLPGFPGVCDE